MKKKEKKVLKVECGWKQQEGVPTLEWENFCPAPVNEEEKRRG